MKLIKLIENIKPVPAPRMSRRDRFDPRPAVIKYRDYGIELRSQFTAEELPSNYLLVFYLPMAKSWSKKKKRSHYLQPHTQTPDKDNLEKGFLDALFYQHDEHKDDSHIWDGRTIKLWKEGEGAIAIYQIDCVLELLVEQIA